MPDYKALEQRFQQILNLPRRPVAVSFSEETPAKVDKFSGSEPAGCSFWRLAAEGRSFATVPSDHYNCPVGSYTHHIALPEDRAQELPSILGTMTSLGYLKMEEVPGIPVLPQTPKTISYAPLGDTAVDPDVVLFAMKPGTLMLLEEAAIRAGAASKLPLLARPTCMAIPAALASGMVTSAGCIGNRVYTRIGEDELYAALPGRALESVAQELETVATANHTLDQYHRARQSQLSTA
ncbi:MAG TPA: DUF169 domain-containing protein [Bryobacteraceae bacterium]|nr:DUF169 domain-containing protein [Bryobacteraceae bacterium]